MEAGNHLTPEQELQAAIGKTGPSVTSHLESCEACQSGVAGWRSWLDRWAGPETGEELRQPGIDCLSPEEIARFATASSSGNGLLHAASCDRCGAILREAMKEDALSQEETELLASLDTSSLTWRRQAAMGVMRPCQQRLDVRWLAIAAAILVAIGAGLWALMKHRTSTEQLLAQAYHDRPPFDYRLPGDHPDEGTKRLAGGSILGNPALAEAFVQIQRRNSPGAESAADLFLQGRAELLEGSQSAIDALTRSLELQPDNAEALSDLACAYALRADGGQTLEYGRAIDLIGRSLRIKPDQPRTIYNLGLIYTRMSLVDEEIDAWDRYLKLDPSGAWAVEARQLRKDAEDVRESRRKASSYPRDPAGFLALVKKGNVEPELYVDSFWENWLPALHSDPAALQAASGLAELFVKTFGDESLRDAVLEAQAADASGELRGLADLLHASETEQYDAAVSRARTLVASLAARGQSAARERASIETVFDLTRVGKADAGLAESAESLRRISAHKWIWLRLQMQIQRASCQGRVEGPGFIRDEVESTRDAARQAGLGFLALKAATFLTNVDLHGGNYAQVWKIASDGLKTYWHTGASDFRAQQLIHDLASTAESSGWKECAVLLGRAAVRATARATASSRSRIMEAVNRVHLSAVLREAGYTDESLAELSSAERIFDGAPVGSARDAYKFDAKLRRIETASEGPSASQALHELESIGQLPESVSDSDRVRFYQAKGMAERAGGHIQQAKAAFEEALRIHQAEIARSTRSSDRIAAAALVRESYRHLADLQLTTDHDPLGALNTWEKYRAELAGQQAREAPFGDTPILVYASLPSGLARWISDSNGVRGGIVPESQSRLANSAALFLRQVSDPRSPVANLTDVSRQLYKALVEPYADRISRGTILGVEADDWAASIPFGALVAGNGEYLAARNPIVNLAYVPKASADGGRYRFGPNDPALIVSVSASLNLVGIQEPLLNGAIDDASQVRRKSKQAVVLSDSAATVAAIAKDVRQATLFHFAGHGWSNGGNGGLLLAPTVHDDGRQSANWIDADQLRSQDWSHVRLAVLAACLTATGEAHGPVNSGSLVHALHAAGAKQVIASRWSVDTTATTSLMNYFYDGLYANRSPAEALAAAELQVAGSKGQSHPFYWAGFDVFGQ